MRRPHPNDVKRFRQEHRLSELGQVMPELLLDEHGEAHVCFRCGPCGDLLVWSKEGAVWVCPVCSYQISKEQGIEVLDLAVDAFDRLKTRLVPAKKTKEKRPWYAIFTRRRTPQLPSKSLSSETSDATES